MKHNTILKKIICLFLIIVLPLILLCIVFFMWNNQKLIRETLHTHSMKAHQYVNIQDNNIDQIYNQTSSVVARSELKKLSFTSHIMENYEKYRTINLLLDYIRAIYENNNLLYNIKVYIQSFNTAYNSASAGISSYETIPNDTYEIIANLDTNLPSNIIFYEGRLIMLLKSNSENPASMVEAEFSLRQLKKEFDIQSNYDHSFYIFNFHNGDYILNNITDEDVYTAALAADYKDGISDFKVNGQRYFGFLVHYENMDASYIQIIPSSEIIQPIYFSGFYALFFISFMLVSVVIFFAGVIKIIHNPMTKLINGFEAIENGDLSIRITEYSNSEFSYLYKGFNDMAVHLDNLINEVYAQKILLQKAEFKQLQAQINPHFLYNSFFMLHRTIQNNMPEESLKMSKDLGIYFKYITKTQSDIVSLKEEYLHAKTYSNIQSIRFEGRIHTEFGYLPDAYTNWRIPRLVLQPIIENAYNYGLENKCSNGLLIVSFYAHTEGIDIIIEDNGDELTDDKLAQMNKKLNSPPTFADSTNITGLINISQRIHSFYKNSSTLTVSRSDLGGLKVTIFLSKENEGNFYETIANS